MREVLLRGYGASTVSFVAGSAYGEGHIGPKRLFRRFSLVVYAGRVAVEEIPGNVLSLSGCRVERKPRLQA